MCLSEPGDGGHARRRRPEEIARVDQQEKGDQAPQADRTDAIGGGGGPEVESQTHGEECQLEHQRGCKRIPETEPGPVVTAGQKRQVRPMQHKIEYPVADDRGSADPCSGLVSLHQIVQRARVTRVELERPA